VLAAMQALDTAREPIDTLTVSERLRAAGQLDDLHGQAAVEELMTYVPAAGHAVQYAKLVHDHAQRRRVLAATYEIQSEVFTGTGSAEELIEAAEQTIFRLRAERHHRTHRLLEDAVSEEIDRLQQAVAEGRAIPGLSTGLPELDRTLGGLQDGRLYVLAARPAMGKSLLTLQIARHVAADEHQRVLFASLEMSDSETAQRHLAAESGVDPERLHLGDIRDPDWPALLAAAETSAGLPFHLLDDGDLSLGRLRAQTRQVAVRNGAVRLIVVDYLQLMRAERPSGSRVEDVSEFSRGLKRLAREMSCPVIAVAQLSRAVEQRPDKRPVLSDLRGSGQIEADADCVLMLYRDDYYDPDSERPGEMDIIIRKNRQGRLARVTTKIDQRLRYRPHRDGEPPF
jgi:replicative DNA helicase